MSVSSRCLTHWIFLLRRFYFLFFNLFWFTCNSCFSRSLWFLNRCFFYLFRVFWLSFYCIGYLFLLGNFDAIMFLLYFLLFLLAKSFSFRFTFRFLHYYFLLALNFGFTFGSWFYLFVFRFWILSLSCLNNMWNCLYLILWFLLRWRFWFRLLISF